MQRGGLTLDGMAGVGGREEIAPYPDYIAKYLVHKDPSPLNFLLLTGDLMGSQPVHIRHTSGTLISIDDQPGFWLDGRAGAPDQPLSVGAINDTGPLFPDIAHLPTISYACYMFTGDRYHKDEQQFWGNWCLVETTPAACRNYAEGIVDNNQPRGFAWGLRGMVEAALCTPDSETVLKAYFRNKIAASLQWGNDYVQGLRFNGFWFQAPGPLGSCFEMNPIDGIGAYILIIPYMNNYLAWSVWRANELGFAGGEIMRDRLIAFTLLRFNSEPGFPKAWAAPFRMLVGTGAYSLVPWVYYSTMTEIYNHNSSVLGWDTIYTPDFINYGIDTRLILILADRLGMTGALAAYDYLQTFLTSGGTPGVIQPGFNIKKT